MPRLIAPKELGRLVALIAEHPNGIASNELLRALGGGLQPRSLQRRLALLVGQGRIRLLGARRSARYAPATRHAPALGAGVQSGHVAAEETPVGDDKDKSQEKRKNLGHQDSAEATDSRSARWQLPISPEGKEILAHVRQARHLRQPVGYQLEFLEKYHPNRTFYLPQGLRDQLHLIGRPPAGHNPAGTFARDILNRLLIDLSWASSQLEGNTYSRLDTEKLIQFGQAAEGKDALETQMILNHKQAIEYLVNDPDHARLTPGTVIALHALLSDGLMADPMACGRLRSRAVEIAGSVYLPVGLPQRLEELFGIVVQNAAEIVDPFEQSFFLMVHLPYLQPFEDVNKRVSRLVANIPFIRHNLCPLSFIDVPQQAYVDATMGVYELNRVDLLRDVFVWAYERSCQQYVAVKQNLVPPDIFRLRHRQALGEVVAAIVRRGEPATPATVRANLPVTLAKTDKRQFIQLVLAELSALHPGNAVRFGIRPLEFEAWRKGRVQARGRSA